MATLSEYLRTRGLNLDPTTVDEDLVLLETGLTKEVSDLWVGHSNAIKAVLQARVNSIAKVILEKAIPEEVGVLRQALVEIGAIVTDFESYVAEQKRRDAKTPTPQDEVEATATEPPREGGEGSL